MSSTRVLEKVHGSVFRYRYGSYQFSACGDEHAHRMKDAVLENEAKQDKPFQEDPLTPQMRLKLGPLEAERQARALCPIYRAAAAAEKKAAAIAKVKTKPKGKSTP